MLARSSAKILISQPDETLQFLLREICTSEGYEVVGAAADIETTLALIAEQQPDILIHDFVYSTGGNGLELIERAKRRQPDLLTVLLTGWDINEIAARPEPMRPDRLMRQPVPVATIAATLGELTPLSLRAA